MIKEIQEANEAMNAAIKFVKYIQMNHPNVYIETMEEIDNEEL